MEDKEKNRSNAKRALTKGMNRLKLLKAESTTPDVVRQNINDIKLLYNDFELAHDLYHNELCQFDDDKDIDNSENYFYIKQEEYINVLEDMKYLDLKVAPSNYNLQQSSSHFYDMPRLELEKFGGDPLHYHQFIRSFQQNVEIHTDNYDARLSRLLQYTEGPAKTAIRGCQLLDGQEGYIKAMNILQDRFGDPHLITEHIIRDLIATKSLKSPTDLQQFADRLTNAQIILEKLEMTRDVDSQSMLINLTSKIQPFLQIQWKKHALTFKKSTGNYPLFSELVKFISDASVDMNDPVYGTLSFMKQPKEPKTCLNTFVSDKYAREEAPCILCSLRHRLWNCEKFRIMSPKNRLELVCENKLCRNCLLGTHETAKCGKKSTCSICGEKHTKYIHIDNFNVETPITCNSASTPEKVYMPIVEVTVNECVQVYALLDTASTNTFCTRELAEKLGVKSNQLSYNLNTLNGQKWTTSNAISLNLSNCDNGEDLMAHTVFIVDKIPVSSSDFKLERYPHLREINKQLKLNREINCVDILIGQDCPEALIPLEVKSGKRGEPFAVRTMFGWSLNGKDCFPLNKSHKTVLSYVITLEDQISKLWNMENSGMDESKSYSLG
ncbi:hypothetical protein GQR58_007609 [Nymphon striatum]|nr:hypothetical protein GQR58_007609 [Nymphon striatum]